MIDIENQVFTKIAAKLRAKFPNIKVYGEEIRSPSSFPCACVVEADNYVLKRTQDSGSNENHVNVMYEVNIYSNKTNGKKTECKKILTVIDDVLIGMGFTRSMKKPVSMDDATIYRMIVRYSAIVSKNQTIYRR